VHRGSVIVLILSLVISGVAVWGTRTIVGDQDARLLTERANEVAFVFNARISPVATSMTALGEVAGARNLGLFEAQARQLVNAAPSTSTLTYAWLRPSGSGYVVVAAIGKGLHAGDMVSEPAAAVITKTRKTAQMIATPVFMNGRSRWFAFIVAAPSATPAAAVVYRVSDLGGPIQPPRQAGTAPFHELHVVLYASGRPDPNQVLVATTPHLPLRGSVRYVPINAGATRWLLAVAPTQPLVGSVAEAAPWFVVLVGIAGALLLTVVVEQLLRRRDVAVAMYHGERELAETLQQKLLPTLPHLAGLDVASRYITASAGQSVGGDWFDVFDLHDGRAAVAIGDVIGHDIEAAAAMSQVRAALRAYAWEGGEPAAVVNQLAALVENFHMAGLVTLVYGVLGRPDHHGSRQFRWANAGHLPPLLRLPHGEVVELTAGSSRVIGAPADDPRSQGDFLAPRGSMLLLYTDGLVELPGIALTDSLARVRASFQGQDRDAPAEDVCDSILRTQPTDRSRDDIAIMVARIVGDQVPSAVPVPTAAHSEPSGPS
jgi:serine phosphatase RsbU (regulator of sigma subunit)